MKTLVINAGSSSLKCQYFIDGTSVVTVLIEQIGTVQSHAQLHYKTELISHTTAVSNHHEALTLLISLFKEAKVLHSFEELDAVGHRVVHGGDRFSAPTHITQAVIDEIQRVTPLAPLHNPANLEAIRAFASSFPKLPQVAIFDTAFHQSMPEYASDYAIPLALKTEYHIRRYGFHGISHSYLTKEAAEFLNIPRKSISLITLHLGNGASATAIKDGQSVDTSMGLTPLEGLVMGSRSGNIDPAVIPYLVREGYTIEEVDTLLNKESGLKGLYGTNDMREITAAAKKKDPQALLALQIYTYRICKYIGSYAAILGKIDAIVFSGGIGENSSTIREMVCEKLQDFLGIEIDREKNETESQINRAIHKEISPIALLVIPTNEELEIARQTEKLITQGTQAELIDKLE
jgi:acetate kinase